MPYPTSARAADVSTATFTRLVDRAPEDPQARARLGDVDSVDGRPVNLEPVLAGASEDELEQRLAALAATSEVRDAGSIRRQAAEILAERRYDDADGPRPIKGLAEWVAERMEQVANVFDDVARSFPGGNVAFWLVVAIAVVAIAAAVAARLAGRRGRAPRSHAVDFGPTDDPDSLERRAEAAERDGDLETALRLRFRAGLLRLAAFGVVPRTSSLTSEHISTLLNSPTFDRLAATFDRVVYGRRPIMDRDIEEARRGWRSVESEARA